MQSLLIKEPVLKGFCLLNSVFTILFPSLTYQFISLDKMTSVMCHFMFLVRMINISLYVLEAKHTEYIVSQISISEARHSDVWQTSKVCLGICAYSRVMWHHTLQLKNPWGRSRYYLLSSSSSSCAALKMQIGAFLHTFVRNSEACRTLTENCRGP